jgi:hypothetical protein
VGSKQLLLFVAQFAEASLVGRAFALGMLGKPR